MFTRRAADYGDVDNVSRPLIALLVGTVALFALYFVALRGSSTQGTNKQSVNGFKSDISAAHKAVGTANHAAAGAGGDLAQPSNAPAGSSTTSHAPASKAPATSTAGTTTKPATSHRTSDASKAEAAHAAKSASAASALSSSPAAKQHRLNVVAGALAHKKVLALLFYNPAASDDRAVKNELATVPTHRGLVVKLAVPISELASFQSVDTQIPVNQTPTLLLVNREREATTIVGFADSFEISQRVADAVAVK